MRNELVEIISRWDQSEPLVDHLLKNGVIAPPCKVGDEVYFIVTRIEKQGRKNVCADFVETGIADRFIIGESNILMIDICTSSNSWIAIEAKDVYRTRAEAEKHLQKGTNQNEKR